MTLPLAQSSRRLLCRIVFATVATMPLTSIGHDPGLSTNDIVLGDKSITVTLKFEPMELFAAVGIPDDAEEAISDGRRQEILAALERLAPSLIRVAVDGRPILAEQIGAALDAPANAILTLRFPLFPGGRRLAVDVPILVEMDRQHSQVVKVSLPGQETTLTEKLLDPAQRNFQIALPGADAPPEAENGGSFRSFVALGVEHIVTGYDHLLFLFGLLLVCARFSDAVKVITVFTLAHSITLALATFHLVDLPSRIVEPVIAASIVYVGVENTVRRDPMRWRWVLTFVFGLVHGLGFASVLREMGVGSGATGVALSLFSFNLGVELGQLAVAALILPLIFLMRRRPVFVRRAVPVLSWLVASLGAFWFVQRVFF